MYSLLIKEEVMAVQKCEQDGTPIYGNKYNYFGCRIIEDKIEVCIPQYGWIPVYKEIQDKYNNEIADTAILGG